MYYLAFFIDYHPFFKKKLTAWLSHRKSYGCYIKDKTQKYNSVPKGNLLDCPPENSYYYYDEPWYSRYGKVWYICDQDDEYHASELPYLLIEKNHYPINLEKISFLLTWFAEHYQWSIIPWNNIISFRSFVFVSKNKELMEKFVSCSSNIVNIPFVNRKNNNLLISTYEVTECFSNNTKAIIFEENVNTIGKIWEVCTSNTNTPKLITNIDLDRHPFLNLSKDLYTHSITKTRKRKKTAWHVYQPHNKKSFELVSTELVLKAGQLDGTAFWTSENTDISKLQKILIRTYPYNISYSDLIYLQDFLNICDWLYGFGRDISTPDNYNCSLFISRNSTMIQEIDIIRQEKNNILPSRNYHYNLLANF